jgi:hypothetical protein
MPYPYRPRVVPVALRRVQLQLAARPMISDSCICLDADVTLLFLVCPVYFTEPVYDPLFLAETQNAIGAVRRGERHHLLCLTTSKRSSCAEQHHICNLGLLEAEACTSMSISRLDYSTIDISLAIKLN